MSKIRIDLVRELEVPGSAVTSTEESTDAAT